MRLNKNNTLNLLLAGLVLSAPMIAGAAEAPLTPITFGAFDVVNVLSTLNDNPEAASRPFDNKRGAGAGTLDAVVPRGLRLA